MSSFSDGSAMSREESGSDYDCESGDDDEDDEDDQQPTSKRLRLTDEEQEKLLSEVEMLRKQNSELKNTIFKELANMQKSHEVVCNSISSLVGNNNCTSALSDPRLSSLKLELIAGSDNVSIKDLEKMATGTRFERVACWPHAIGTNRATAVRQYEVEARRRVIAVKFKLFDIIKDCKVAEEALGANRSHSFTLTLCYHDNGKEVNLDDFSSRLSLASLTEPPLDSIHNQTMSGGELTFTLKLLITSSDTSPPHRKFFWKVMPVDEELQSILSLTAATPAFVVRSKVSVSN
jgi:hypothetical protein